MTATPYSRSTPSTFAATRCGRRTSPRELAAGAALLPIAAYAYFPAVVTTLFGVAPAAAHHPDPARKREHGSWSSVRSSSRRVGVIAGVLLATYGPMILEDLARCPRWIRRSPRLPLLLRGLALRRTDLMAVAGLVFGITVIGVGQWLLALVGLTVYAAYAAGVPRALAPRLAALFLGGALVALVPIIAWNSWQGGGFMLTSGDAGLNLYLGNNPLTTGL
jgi:hypothetical protein